MGLKRKSKQMVSMTILVGSVHGMLAGFGVETTFQVMGFCYVR
jgi:hypothetical protein